MEKIDEVPICVWGGIIPAGYSFCQDGATHIIETATLGGIRLVPTNDSVKKQLEEFEHAKVIVSVCGYPRTSALCTHLEVYFVGLASAVGPVLQKIAAP